MRQLSRVVWHEGMHLSQHHFQAQSRYFEDAIHFAVSQLYPFAYGLAGIALDAEALHNGTVSLIHARGLMPDGLAFSIPEGDPPPEPRDVTAVFSPTQDSHVVHLALPAFRREGANATGLEQLGGGAATLGAARPGSRRFHHEPRPMIDETLGRDERAVGVGRKSFRLVLDVEVEEGDVLLPIARVRRSGSGHFVYDPDYIPPLLQIGASERLVQIVRRIVEMLDVKGETLGARRRPDALGEFAANEVASFWLLHTIHASLAPLRHHMDSRRTSPDALYAELARLAGALCTFSLQSHPRMLPSYDHDRLEETFGLIDRHIRDHLNVIIPDNCLRLPLVRQSNVLHTAQVEDQRMLGRSRWILGVRGALTPSEVAQRVPQFAKVCANKFILRLVERALPGLSLEVLGSPPPAVAPRSDTTYFAVGKVGPCWDTIVQTREVGVYVPDAIPDAELELMVVLEG